MASSAMSGSLLIQASNIHTGGGATLLRPLLLTEFPQKRRVWVDSRFSMPEIIDDTVECSIVQRTIAARLSADAEVARVASSKDVLLCLGNLPPIKRTAARTIVYLQNRFLVGPAQLSGLPFRERARLSLERLWLASLVSHAQTYLVQTPSMQKMVCEHLKLREEQVRVAPFLPSVSGWSRQLQNDYSLKQEDQRPFLYVASGEAHKNHHCLVLAWVELANEGLFPTLQLTLDPVRSKQLIDWIHKQSLKYGLNIKSTNINNEYDVKNLYGEAQALIYPSRVESFGLPLVEARQAGLAILAAELDYVRDVLDPEEVFDPSSPRSIARAIKRFIRVSEPNLPSLNAASFLKMIWEDCRE